MVLTSKKKPFIWTTLVGHSIAKLPEESKKMDCIPHSDGLMGSELLKLAHPGRLVCRFRSQVLDEEKGYHDGYQR